MGQIFSRFNLVKSNICRSSYLGTKVTFLYSESGLLASYSFLKKAKKSQIIATKTKLFAYVARFYLRRIWRISPPYYLSLLVCVGLTRYFIHGPFYNQYESLIANNPLSLDMCHDYFWSNLLYINNFIPNVSFYFDLSF